MGSLKVINYFECKDKEHWLEKIGKGDWKAGEYLYELLSTNTLAQVRGDNPRVYMLTDGQELISYCLYSQIDDVQPTVYSPWIGFAYTYPKYRGHRYMEMLIHEVEKIAREENVWDIHISTAHVGLYEKYGYEHFADDKDIEGCPVRLYRKNVVEGNDMKYSLEMTPELSNSPLKDKVIIFLGSSVTYGSDSLGVSFVDYMEKRDGVIGIKEAVSGTTLVCQDAGDESYISRMWRLDKNIKADALVCQLSTNDASQQKPMGSIYESFAIENFDITTITGAIEYIIAYSKATWNCPIVFYTGTKYDSDTYAQMVELLHQIQKKWDIGVIDMWNNSDMNHVSEKDYKLYMSNPIHPTQAGYREWWLPVMEEYLYDYL